MSNLQNDIWNEQQEELKNSPDQEEFDKQSVADFEKTLKVIKYQNDTLNFVQKEINKALGL